MVGKRTPRPRLPPPISNLPPVPHKLFSPQPCTGLLAAYRKAPRGEPLSLDAEPLLTRTVSGRSEASFCPFLPAARLTVCACVCLCVLCLCVRACMFVCVSVFVCVCARACACLRACVCGPINSSEAHRGSWWSNPNAIGYAKDWVGRRAMGTPQCQQHATAPYTLRTSVPCTVHCLDPCSRICVLRSGWDTRSSDWHLMTPPPDSSTRDGHNPTWAQNQSKVTYFRSGPRPFGSVKQT